MTQRIFLQKTSEEDRKKNEKLPYFRLVLIPEEEGGEWKDLGAFWKAKSGNGYSGKTNDGVTITLDGEEEGEEKDYKKLKGDDEEGGD